jgi:hypothetical protein
MTTEEAFYRLRQLPLSKLGLEALDALHAEMERLKQEVAEWKAHAAITDTESLQLEDWLITNKEIDPKEGLIDRQARLKERVRDLIAKEGEVGDLKSELVTAQACCAEMRVCIQMFMKYAVSDPLTETKARGEKCLSSTCGTAYRDEHNLSDAEIDVPENFKGRPKHTKKAKHGV